MRRRRRGDEGNAMVELLLSLQALLAIAMLMLYAGRYNVAATTLDGEARSAARTISLARNPAAAVAAARAQAADGLNAGSVMCREMTFPPPVITADTVTVTITCAVDLEDAFLIQGLPGRQAITATATEVIDRYRERG